MDEQENHSNPRTFRRSFRKIFIYLFLFTFSIHVAVQWRWYGAQLKTFVITFLANDLSLDVYDSNYATIDNNILKIFKDFDLDNDGYLTPIEFQRAYFYIKVKDSNKPFSNEKSANPLELETFTDDVKEILKGQKFDENAGEVIYLNVSMKPFDLLTMKKFIDDPIFLEDDQTMFHLDGLKSWRQPHIQSATLRVLNFSRTFLPKNKSIAVGDTWEIIPKVYGNGGAHLTQKRYIPPNPDENEKLLVYLLSMFHPRPFIHMRFPPRGAICCLKAINDEYYDIMFRFHPEFQLNTPPRYPFWFTPASMVGNIVIKKDGSHVEFFDMHLPTKKRLNIDMEWVTGTAPEKSEFADVEKQNNDQSQLPGEVDIGFMEELRLQSIKPSLQYGNNISNVENIKWSQHISFDRGFDILEKEFYPFKKVSYIPFNETLKAASEQGKLIHHVLLWGSLDDQSC